MNSMMISNCITGACLVVGWILVFIGRKQKNAKKKKVLYFLYMSLFVIALLSSGYGVVCSFLKFLK